MTENEGTLPARVVVAINLLRRGAETLEMAAGLAAKRQARLLALFVEDMNLVNLAELPFAREVERLSAAERKMESLRLQRATRTCKERLQRLLEEINRELRVETDFKAVRGDFITSVLAETAQLDILFLGCRGDVEGPPRTPAKPSQRSPVWTIYDGSPESERALRLGLELADADAENLCVTLPAESDARFEDLRAQALMLCRKAIPPRFFRADPSDGTKLRRQIRRIGCRLLILKRSESDSPGALTERAECPVVLI